MRPVIHEFIAGKFLIDHTETHNPQELNHCARSKYLDIASVGVPRCRIVDSALLEDIESVLKYRLLTTEELRIQLSAFWVPASIRAEIETKAHIPEIHRYLENVVHACLKHRYPSNVAPVHRGLTRKSRNERYVHVFKQISGDMYNIGVSAVVKSKLNQVERSWGGILRSKVVCIAISSKLDGVTALRHERKLHVTLAKYAVLDPVYGREWFRLDIDGEREVIAIVKGLT